MLSPIWLCHNYLVKMCIPKINLGLRFNKFFEYLLELIWITYKIKGVAWSQTSDCLKITGLKNLLDGEKLSLQLNYSLQYCFWWYCKISSQVSCPECLSSPNPSLNLTPLPCYIQDWGLEMSEFKYQWYYYIHFLTNTQGKWYEILLSLSYIMNRSPINFVECRIQNIWI